MLNTRKLRIEKTFAFLILTLLITSAFTIIFTKVYADGVVDAQLVIINYSINNQLPDGFGSQDDTVDIEDIIRLSYLTFINGTSFNYTITEIRVHQYGSGTAGYQNELTYLIYNGTTGSPYASDLLYNYTVMLDGSVYGWRSNSCNVTVPLGLNGVYIGAWMDGGIGNWEIYRDTSVSGAYSAHKAEAHPGGLEAQAPDPLTGESQDTSYAVEVTVDYIAHNRTETTFNQYYGDTENFTARRDVSANFPSNSINRQLNITYPNDEYVLNITRSNGGLWDEKLSTSEYSTTSYNDTHSIITIPHATISLYGGDYRIFTTSYPYLYTFHGGYYENGTFYGNISVHAHTGESDEELLINGTLIKGFNTKPELFSFDVGEGQTRLIYTFENAETFYVLIPEDTMATYGFVIRDYSGVTSDGAFLEAHRSVNATERLVTRMDIQNAINEIPVLLTYGKTYHLKIFTIDETVYDFGYFVAGVEDEPTLILNELVFTRQVQLAYKYINIEVTRNPPETIELSYQDTRSKTIGLQYHIYYRNGTAIYETSNVGVQQCVFTWDEADNETDYRVVLEIEHTSPPTGYGNITFEQVMLYGRDVTSPFNFSGLGNSAIDLSQVLPVGLVWAFGGIASWISAPIGSMIVVVMATAFRYYGWMNNDYTLLAFAMGLAISLAFSRGRER